MAVNELIIPNDLPFASVDDLEINHIFNNQSLDSYVNYSQNLEFDSLAILDDKYNNELDINELFTHYRHFNVPKSEYIFLDNFSLPINNSNIITLLNMNIRSIPRNIQTFTDTILNNISTKFDVLGFTEVRLDAHLAQLYEIPGYRMCSNSRNTHGGGVALYISDNHHSSVQEEFSFVETFIECIGVEVNIMNRSLFVCIYRPPSGNIKFFLDVMTEILSIAHDKKYQGIFVFGDFNLDLFRNNENSINDFINLMYSYALFPLITKPSRITETTATLIDHIWTSQLESNVGNYIIHSDISDHFPIFSQFKINSSKPDTRTHINKRIITPTALEQFNNELAHVNWNNVFTSSCPNYGYDIFYDEFNKLFEIHFPIRKTRINNKNVISPYITPALKSSIKEKNRLERLAKKWPLTYENFYKKYRNKLTATLRAAKNKYYKDKLKENQGNPKNQWNIISSILGRTNNVANKHLIELTPACDDTATAFNDHFLNTGTGGLYLNAAENDYMRYLGVSPNFSMYLIPVHHTEVENHLNALKPTASGYDDISPKILKHSSSIISIPLAHIINLSFKTGIFPDQLKKAKVIPMYKSGNRGDINNYRPISVLPAFSKIIEKVIATRLINYLENNKLLSEQQHGFRANRSTESAVLQFVSNVYKLLEQKLNVAGVFIDLSKAFDTLDHKILLNKMQHLGIRGLPLKLFQSYLSNRAQAVLCNMNYSSFNPIRRGVPQGSILGPLLFLIYINDITHASSKFKFIIYADDTNLLLAEQSINSLHSNLTSELKLIYNWIHINKLKLNISKTNYILFQNRSLKKQMPPLSLEGETIKQANQIKFLGVRIDENLNWRYHIEEVCLKLSKMCGILYKVRGNLTTEAMISIYYTLCYSRLIYCVAIWGSTWPSFLTRLIVMQNKILRCIFFMKKFDSTTAIFTENKLLQFESIHKYFSLLLIFKTVRNLGENKTFKFVETFCNTRRNNTDLDCPQFRTTLFKNSLICYGPQLFNSLPLDQKLLLKTSSIFSFKKEIRKYLLELQNSN